MDNSSTVMVLSFENRFTINPRMYKTIVPIKMYPNISITGIYSENYILPKIDLKSYLLILLF
jgi:hypothetical protein